METIKRRDILLLIVITLFGALLRFYNIGELSLWNNEDYTAISSRAILDFGYPIFPSGIIYPRGLPFSYVTALSVQMFGFSEFSLRLPSATFSTLSIPLVYIFARQVINQKAAILAAFIIAIFYWDIQAAHTARMYSMFSFFMLLSMVLVHAAEINEKYNLRILTIASIIISAFLHQIAIALILMLLLFIPYLIAKNKSFKPIILYVVIFIISYVIAYGFETIQYNNWSELSSVNTESKYIVKKPLLSRITLSSLPLYTHLIESYSTYKLILPLILGTLSLWVLIKALHEKNKIILYFYLGLIILLLTFHQFIVTLLTFPLLLLVASWRNVYFNRNDYASILFIFTIYLIFWISYSLNSTEALSLLSLKQSVKMLFTYPPSFLRLYFGTYPWLTLLVLITGTYILINTIKVKFFSGASFVLFVFFLPIITLGFHPAALERLYDRYIYFLSPYFIIIAANGAYMYFIFCYNQWKYSTKLTAAYFSLLIPVFIVVSKFGAFDISYNYINSTYGENKYIYNSWLGKYNYQPDYKGPSMFVADNYQDGDIVIVMDILAHFSYFPHADYQLTRSLKRDAEGWIGTKTIYTTDMLIDVFNENTEKNIWVVTAALHLRDFKDDSNFYNLLRIIKDRAGEPVFIGADDLSSVYCIGCTQLAN